MVRIRTLLAVVFCVVLGMVFYRARWTIQSFGDALGAYQHDVERDDRLATAIRHARTVALELDTGLSGWLLTGEASSRAPYDRASQIRARVFDDLIAAENADADGLSLVLRLRDVLDGWDRDTATPLMRRAPDTRNPEVLAVALEGRRRMDQVRLGLDALEQGRVLGRGTQARAIEGQRRELLWQWTAIASVMGIVLVLLWALTVRSIEQPVAKLVEQARRIARGEFAAIEVEGVAEVRALAQAANQMAAQLSEERERERRYTAMVTALSAGGDLGTVARAALGSLVTDYGASRGIIWVARQQGASLEPIAVSAVDRASLDHGPSAHVLEVRGSGRRLFVDAEGQGSLRAARDDAGPTVERRIVAPIANGASLVVAVLELDGLDVRRRTLDELDRGLSRIGLSLENALAVERASALDREIGEQRAQFAAVVQALAESVLVWDARGTCQAANPAADRMFGACVGRDVAAVCRRAQMSAPDGAELAPEECATFDAVAPGAPGSKVARRIVDAVGQPRVAVFSSVPLYRGDAVVGAVWSARDVTEEYELSQKLAEANRELVAQNRELHVQDVRLRAQSDELARGKGELAARNEELARASRMKSEFLASMSHELRTPLNAIIGFSEVLLAGSYGPLTERQERCVRDVLAGGRQLLVLINDVLDLSRIEAGRLLMNIGDIDLAEPVAEAAALLSGAAHEKSITLDDLLTPGTFLATADSDKVRQVVINLLSNAVKFTPSGGHVRIEARVDGDAVQVCVSDTGIGISSADASKLFEPFSQVDSGYARKYGGTGLGLSICKRLIGLMGGDIGFTSEPGKGARFFFTLPAADARATVREGRGGGPELPLVLLVTEDEDEARSVEHTLVCAGYALRVVRTSDEALASLARTPPSVILVDLGLPDFAGVDLVAGVAQRSDLASVAIGVLEASDRATPPALQGLVRFVAPRGDWGRSELLERLSVVCAPAAPPASAHARRARVLVVDASPIDRRALGAMLDELDCEVAYATDGASALTQARERQPAVVLLDVGQAAGEGFQAVHTLVGDPGTRGIPVIGVSDRVVAGDAERAASAGCAGYVTKPIARAALVAAIDRAVGDASWRTARAS